MMTYTLPRDGQRPLQFDGTHLAESQGKHYGTDPARWYDLTVYQTPGGRYIVHWEYHTQWQGEHEHSRVEDLLSLAAVATELEDFDPCDWLVAYRPLLERGEASAESTFRPGRRRWNATS